LQEVGRQAGRGDAGAGGPDDVRANMPDFGGRRCRWPTKAAGRTPAKGAGRQARSIIISDGDPGAAARAPCWRSEARQDPPSRRSGWQTHGAPQGTRAMQAIAHRAGQVLQGEPTPTQLPAIYIKESRIVQPVGSCRKKRFEAAGCKFRSGPTEEAAGACAAAGRLRADDAERTTPLVEIPDSDPKVSPTRTSPLLAVLALRAPGPKSGGVHQRPPATRASGRKDWAEGGVYGKFLGEQLVELVRLRPVGEPQAEHDHGVPRTAR